MELYSAYNVGIKDYHHIFDHTVKLYQQAVSFFLTVCEIEWVNLEPLTGKERCNRMERLTLRTKRNPDPKYDFNARFYKMPAYLRRAAIRASAGAYSSYQTALKNWQEHPEGKRPFLQRERNLMPVLYKDNMFVRTGEETARIKIFHKNDWVWLPVLLRHRDVAYIKRHCRDKTECSPILKRKGKRWVLSFPFKEQVFLPKKPINEQVICAVDLGLNNHAVCSIMASDGTVTARKFIDFPVEKDHQKTILNRIKKVGQHGIGHCPTLWKHANDTNKEISRKVSGTILMFALEYHADAIVFEHLNTKGKKQGSKKQRLHLWRKQEIQQMTERKAHQNGIRISRVCAFNTSRLAYDGTGPVTRGTCEQNGVRRYNYSICVFQTGKVYHCDLNASYNIGARYFIRELLKSYPVMDGLPDGPKDARYGTGSTRTLSDLYNLNADLGRMAS